jgi:hypothetical protein
MSVGL